MDVEAKSSETENSLLFFVGLCVSSFSFSSSTDMVFRFSFHMGNMVLGVLGVCPWFTLL